MTRRRFHACLCRTALYYAAILGFVQVPAVQAADKPPNVLFILSDDQAWTDYGFTGHPVIKTPNLDRLAAESLTFTRGYVPSSLCRPSLMTMLTGLYPHQHGISGNDPPKGTDRGEMLRHIRRLPALPRLLAAQGYQCLQTGKWWEGNFREGGFTDGMSHGDPKKGGRHGDEGLAIGRQGLSPIFDFVDRCGDKPFFIWYAPMLPHSPHNPPERLLKKYAGQVESPHVAKYYAMCEWWDETVGELLTFLEVKRLQEKTLVVYVTDNGWIQNPRTPQFAPRSKRTPYEGGVRTPIMFRWPGKIAPRLDQEHLASSLDLLPSILAACGAPPVLDLPGSNLLANGGAASETHPILFGEIFSHDVADIDRPAASLEHRWCVNNEWKLILPEKEGAPELYAIRTDPAEKQNVAEQEPEVVAQLRGQVDRWWQPQGPSEK